MARKSKYNSDYHFAWIIGLTRRGITLSDIAKDIGVSLSTLNKWIHDNEELSDAIKKARVIPDIKVEDSLYNRAIGMKVTKKRTIVEAGDSMKGNRQSKIEILEEELPPDSVACIFWLKNRRPDLWREKQNVNVNVNAFEKLMQELPDDEE